MTEQKVSKMANVTIKDMAERLGVSPATVSLALNGRHGVNEETRMSVLNLANQLGYRNTTAKKTPPHQGVINFLIYRKSGRIVTDTQFFTRLIESVEQATRSHRYALTITYCTGQEQLPSCIQEAVDAQSLGILVLGTEMEQDDLPILEKASIPVVILDNELPASSLDMISIHNFDGVWRAVQHLQEQGLTDVGYLRSSVSITNFEMRYMGYAYASYHFNGTPPDPEKIFSLSPTIDGAKEDMDVILQKGTPIPSALIADNDLIAIGAARALLAAGLRIPEDVSIIGFDNIPLAEYFQPALTSIEVSCEELGKRAVSMVRWRIRHPDAPPQNILTCTKLISRDSVRMKSAI